MTELRHEDFDELDQGSVYDAGAALIAAARDLIHHHSDGTDFATWPEPHEDAVQAAAVVREMIDKTTDALKLSRQFLGAAERRAKLRAMRRARAHGGGS